MRVNSSSVKSRVSFGLVRDERLLQLRLRHAIDVRVDPVERAVGRQEIRRRLRTDARDPMDVVGGITDQGKKIMEAARRHPPLLLDLGRAEDLVAHRVPQDHPLVVIVNELHQVLVGADDDDAEPRSNGPLRDGRDEVVGLHAVHLVDGDVVAADNLLAALHLLRKVRRRLGALGLVARVHLVTEGRPLRVHRDREVVGPAPSDDLLQHVHGPHDRVRRLPLRRAERGDRVVGAEHVARKVDEIEVLFAPRGRQASAVRRGSRGRGFGSGHRAGELRP
jgi:hypothetical protein